MIIAREVRIKDAASPTGWCWARFEEEDLTMSPEPSGALWISCRAHDPHGGIEMLRVYAPGEWAEIRPFTRSTPTTQETGA